MKKEFDFDDIGKRTPYLTPEHYFEEMQDKVIMAVKKENHKKMAIKWIAISSFAAAAIIAMWIFLPFNKETKTEKETIVALTTKAPKVIDTTHTQNVISVSVKKSEVQKQHISAKRQETDSKKENISINNGGDWIEQLSDEDLNELTTLYDNDILLI